MWKVGIALALVGVAVYGAVKLAKGFGAILGTEVGHAATGAGVGPR